MINNEAEKIIDQSYVKVLNGKDTGSPSKRFSYCFDEEQDDTEVVQPSLVPDSDGL